MMLFSCFVMIVQIVHVKFKPLFKKEVGKRVVHKALEGQGRVAQAKEHDERFPKAKLGNEGCFPFISFFDLYIVKSPVNVKFRKDLGSLETIKNGFNSRERVFVSDSPRVDPSIILCGLFFFILFGDEKEGGCVWG